MICIWRRRKRERGEGEGKGRREKEGGKEREKEGRKGGSKVPIVLSKEKNQVVMLTPVPIKYSRKGGGVKKGR